MLHFAIAAGLVLGLVVGLGAAATGNEWLHAIAKGSAPFGIIFMNAIRMVVIPLIVTVIFTSIAKLGDPRKLGRIGGLTISYYWITLIPAIAIGMATMKVGLQFASEIESVEARGRAGPAGAGLSGATPDPGKPEHLCDVLPINHRGAGVPARAGR